MSEWTNLKPNSAGLFWVRRPDNKLSLVNIRIGGPSKVIWHEGDDLPTLRDLDDPAYLETAGWQAIETPDVKQPIKKVKPEPVKEPALTAAAQANRDNPTRPVPVERPDQANRTADGQPVNRPERTAEQARAQANQDQARQQNRDNPAQRTADGQPANRQTDQERQQNRDNQARPNRSGETPGT